MKTVALCVLIIFVTSLTAVAQTAKPDKVAGQIAIPDLEFTKLENAQLKIANIQMSIQTFQAQVQKAAAELQAELDAAEKAVYDKAGVKKDAYDVDMKAKALVPKQKASPPDAKK
jgi:hypothetical protein